MCAAGESRHTPAPRITREAYFVVRRACHNRAAGVCVCGRRVMACLWTEDNQGGVAYGGQHALDPIQTVFAKATGSECQGAGVCVWQASHGISLAPRITREAWPVVNGVLTHRLRCTSNDARNSLMACV